MLVTQQPVFRKFWHAVMPLRFQKISGVTEPVTTRHMRNAYFLPFSRRLDIGWSIRAGAASSTRWNRTGPGC